MPFESIRSNGRMQIALGLVFGILFGFLLQKGGLTDYGVIVGQLHLTDNTVAEVMLTAILVGMIGIHIMRSAGLVSLHNKSGSIGSTVLGGLIFGAGFAILGYCPGTAAAAFGSGAIDALVGMVGIIIGAGMFARLYPALNRSVLKWGPLPEGTIPELIGIRPAIVVALMAVLIVAVLRWLSI
jgi:uncharacterized membrane protein YedE/YeeE